MKKIAALFLFTLVSICSIFINSAYCETDDKVYDYGGYMCTAHYYFDSAGNKYGLMITDKGELVCIFAVEKDVILKDVVIPESVNVIVQQAFFEDADTVYIPKTVTEFYPMDRVGDHNSVKEFIVDEENPAFCSVDGIIYSKDMKYMMAYPAEKEKTVYKMPDTVEDAYGVWDYHNPTNLKNIIYSSSMSEINDESYPGGISLNDGVNSVYIKSADTKLADRVISDMTNEYEYPFDSSKGPNVIYLTQDSPYKELFENSPYWLTVIDDNYTLEHVKAALKMSLKIYDLRVDLREYDKIERLRPLFDENNDRHVTLADVKIILRKVLKINDSSNENIELSESEIKDLGLIYFAKEVDNCDNYVFDEMRYNEYFESYNFYFYHYLGEYKTGDVVVLEMDKYGYCHGVLQPFKGAFDNVDKELLPKETVKKKAIEMSQYSKGDYEVFVTDIMLINEDKMKYRVYLHCKDNKDEMVYTDTIDIDI